MPEAASAATAPNRQKFAVLKGGHRVWAISAVHGQADQLTALHDELAARLEPGDQLVYLGNLIGRGEAVLETLDEVIAFRTLFLARPGAHLCDIVHLRGAQEEMWQKLLQLQFATDPRQVLAWMLQQGVAASIKAYGGDREAAQRAAGTGVVGITRWTNELRRVMQSHPGHYQLFAALRRAALADDGSLLLVSAGLSPDRPLDAQKDSFWWGGAGFTRMSEPYQGYTRVVRGFAPDHPGLVEEAFRSTLDGGCGFGGPLLAACYGPGAELVDSIEISA
ncbi:hypothetical protein [Limibacillus halophilus]